MKNIKKVISLILLLTIFINLIPSVLASENVVPVELTVEPANLRVTVPLSLPISVDTDGNVSTATNAKIINDSSGPILISSIQLNPKENWELVNFDSDFSKITAGTPKIGIKIWEQDAINGIYLSNNIEGKESINFDYKATLPVQKDNLDINVIDVMFTFDWDVDPESLIDKIIPNRPSFVINKGKTERLVISDNRGNKIENSLIEWNCSDTSVATINDGIIEAVDWGTANITASYNEMSTKVTITIPKIFDGLEMSQNNSNLLIGESLQLIARAKYRDVITWKSSDNSIASVTDGGLVTAKNWGSAIITATQGEYSTTCIITVPKVLNGITINQSTATINKGNTLQLSAITKYRDIITWESDNSNVAIIDQNGLVTAKDWGTATITVKAGEFSDICIVTVPKILDSITLNQTSASIEKGNTFQLVASSKYRESYTWTSSNTSIATVDQNGLVTAKDWGQTTITVSQGNKLATCIITVPKIVNGISISQPIATINKGNTLQLNSTTNYRGIPVWSSSNTNVATVSSTGLVTAKDWGEATITVSIDGFSDTCVVNIPQILNGITISQTTATVNKGTTLQLTSTEKYRGVPIWESSNTSIATVSTTGLVTAKDWGMATITVRLGEFTDSCIITVPKILDSITLNQTSASLEKGKTLQLTASSIYRESYTWVSSNTSIATVDSNGLVTAKNWGTVIITVSQGDKSTTCTITIPQILESISLNYSDTTIPLGNTLQLTATSKYRATLIWSSDNNSIATVSSSGLVKTLQQGIVNITVKAGEISATCKISITEPLPTNLSLNKESVMVYPNDIFLLQSSSSSYLPITWESSDTNIAVVNNGRVVTKSEGVATIKATQGITWATCVVYVVPTSKEPIVIEAEEYARKLYEWNLLRPIGESPSGEPIFGLERQLTRVEGIIMLVRLLGKEQEALKNYSDYKIPFEDVTTNTKPYIAYAYANGLSNGTSPETFAPNNLLKSNEYLTFILRALQYPNINWQKPYDIATSIGLINESQYNQSSKFLFADMVIISYKTLFTKLYGKNTTLAQLMGISESVNEDELIGDVVEVDAGDANNLNFDDYGNYYLDLEYLSDGTIISRDDLVYTDGATTNNNLSNFITIMNEINPNLSWTGKAIEYLGSNLTYIIAVNGVWRLRITNWDAGQNNHNMFLTSLAYFGNKGMASAVYGMLNEHYTTRLGTDTPIPAEVANSYGLTITSEVLAEGGRVTIQITNGLSTWTVLYRLGNSDSQEVVVQIDVK